MSLDSTIGALEIGTAFSLFLFGIVTMQTYMYWSNFNDQDRLSFKLLVATVWLLELGHTIAVSRELYISTVRQPGSPVENPIFGVVTIISGFITTIVQLFFSYRVWTALPPPWKSIGVITALTALARCGMSTYIGAEATMGNLDVEESRPRYEKFITVLLVTAAVIDVLIAASMLSFLTSRRERAVNLMKLIDHLILLTIRTGLITSIAAVSVLILYQAMPHNFIFLALFTCLAKLYSNSLLSALNARNTLRDSAAVKQYVMPISPRSSGSHRGLMRGSKDSREMEQQRPTLTTVPRPIFIRMDTTTEAQRDVDLIA